MPVAEFNAKQCGTIDYFRSDWPADCPAPGLWLIGDHFVGKLSAMGQSTEPSILTGSVNE